MKPFSDDDDDDDDDDDAETLFRNLVGSRSRMSTLTRPVQLPVT